MAIRKRRDIWIADFYVGGRNGSRIRKSFPTKALAESFEQQTKLGYHSGNGTSISGELFLSDLIDKYRILHDSGNRPITQKRNRYILDVLLRVLGDRAISSIRRVDIEAYKAIRAKSVKQSTVNVELRIVRSLFNRALEWGYLAKSPCQGAKLFRVDIEEPLFLSQEEGARLINAAGGALKTFVIVGLYTGLRRGEMFNLKWQDIDFATKELRVRKSKGKRFRIVPICPPLADALKQHPHNLNSSLVFCNSDGSKWTDKRKSFESALKRAGKSPPPSEHYDIAVEICASSFNFKRIRCSAKRQISISFIDDPNSVDHVSTRLRNQLCSAGIPGCDLSQTTALLSCMDLFISCDSGLMHLASALRIPQVAIFGPTDPEVWGPQHADSFVVFSRPSTCPPCTFEIAKNCDHHSCLEKLTVDTILLQVRQAISSACCPLSHTYSHHPLSLSPSPCPFPCHIICYLMVPHLPTLDNRKGHPKTRMPMR